MSMWAGGRGDGWPVREYEQKPCELARQSRTEGEGPDEGGQLEWSKLDRFKRWALPG